MTTNTDEFIADLYEDPSLIEEAFKIIAKDDLASFLQYDNDTYQVAKHHELIIKKYTEAFSEGNKRIIISVPPRHGKSEITSKKGLAWAVANHPNKEVILTTYSQELSNDFSRIARNTLNEHSDVFNVSLAVDSKAVQKWGLEGYKGTVSAVGIGGAITGRGADVLIVDDFIKNSEEANSPATKEKMWEYYQTTLRTRLSPTGSIIIVATRWAEDDLIGRLLQAQSDGNGEDWEYINLSAECESENDPLGRTLGEYLWLDRFNSDTYDSIKKSVGTMTWNALYQQNPGSKTGTIFKKEWFKYYKSLGNNIYEIYDGVTPRKIDTTNYYRFATVDVAATTKTSSDYFVISSYILTPDSEIIIEDVVRTKIELPNQVKLIENVYNRLHHNEIYLEVNGIGLALYQLLKRTSLPIKPIKAESDKLTRSTTIQTKYENGLVFHPYSASYLDDIEAELLAFPLGKHDDFVDTVSYAGIVANKRIGSKLNVLPKGIFF